MQQLEVTGVKGRVNGVVRGDEEGGVCGGGWAEEWGGATEGSDLSPGSE